MPTLIDSLIVALKLDPSDFSKGQKQAAEEFVKTREQAKKTADEIEHDAKNASQFITKLRNEVIGLLAAFTAGRGLKEFTAELTSSDAATGRFAKTLGMSTSELSAWQGAAKLTGGTAEGITGSMQGLTQELQRFSLTGESSAIPYFRALGISITDQNGRIKTASQLYLELADAFQKLDPARAAALGSALGIDQNTINLLIQGRDAVQRYLAEARGAGVASKESAEAAKRLQEAWNLLVQASEQLGRIIFVRLEPALERLLRWLTDLAKWAQQHPAQVEAIFLGLASAAAVFTAVLAGGAFAAAVGALRGLLGLAAAGEIVSAAGGVSALASAFGLLATAIGAIPLAALATMTGFGIYEIFKNWRKAIPEEANGSKGAQFEPGSLQSRMQAERDKQRLVELGWTPEQAAGIVANIQRESGGQANAVGDNGQAFGLAQWHPDRQAEFKRVFGHDIREATRDEQLAFINYELRYGKEKGAGDALKKATSAGEAASIISRQYERPKDKVGEASARAAIAEALSRSPSAAANLPTSAAMAQSVANDNRATSNSISNQMSIGGITINTQAKDAQGIAADIAPALRQSSFATQANYGLG